jgi:hypoxanthine phosphoribosyltransferase
MSETKLEAEVKYFEPPVYLSEPEIRARVRELAAKINDDYGSEELTLICTLKGSIIFFTDLLRHLEMPVTCEFLGMSSYGNQTSTTGEVKVTLDLNEPLTGKHVVIVEDIVDSGLTLSFMLDYLKARRPLSIKTAALLFKPEALKAKDLKIDYIGFQIPNRFVVGYGLDYAEKFRGLPYIGVLET